MAKVCYSCVVDDQPIFQKQALNWVQTLLASGSAQAGEVVVCLVQGSAGIDVAYARRLQSPGCEVCAVPRIGTGAAAYCNKLAQFGVARLREADCCVLCDADIAFAGNIRAALSADAVRAKVVDLDSPPLELLDALFAKTGLTVERSIVPSTVNGRPTYSTNCNGGLCVVPARWFEPLGQAWMKWVRFVFEHRRVLRPLEMHIDQLGFCFAMLELGLPFEPLANSMNFPTHFRPEFYAGMAGVEPLVLHYHRQMDAEGLLLPCGHAGATAAIERVNQMICDGRV